MLLKAVLQLQGEMTKNTPKASARLGKDLATADRRYPVWDPVLTLGTLGIVMSC